ncbi:MAG: hypothetical protein EBR01_09525 [Proteobacteria bacterium]|nr:hypothetical protein [Pseudomonadota bacterium]
MIRKGFYVIVVIFALSHCGKISIAPVQMPPLKAAKMNHLWVTTTDYQSGLLVGIDLVQKSLEPLRIPIHSDAVVRAPKGSPYFYVINRLGADNIEWGDRTNGKVLGQFSVGRATNPQDIAIINPAQAYVTRFQSNKLLKVNPRTGVRIKEIDIFEGADSKDISSTDPDGRPEMTWMNLQGARLLILLQRLNSEKGFEPSNKSQLAVLNTASDRIEQIITLKGTNPVTEMKSFFKGFVVGEAGIIGQKDGGIEFFDSNLNSLGWLTDEEKLGGDIVDCLILDKNRGLAIVAKDTFGVKPTTQLVLFSLVDGSVMSVVKDSGKYSLQQLLLDEERNIVFVSDRDPKKPGILALDSRSLVPLFASYYQTGLPPYHMVLAE